LIFWFRKANTKMLQNVFLKVVKRPACRANQVGHR
jgi:hypothetical protein